MMGRTVLAGITIVSMLLACNKKNQEPEVVDNPQEAVLKLNKNVEGLKGLAAGIVAADSIAIFSIQYNEDGSVLYRVNLKESGDVDLYSEIVTYKIKVPELSMNQVGEDFFWAVNGSFLMDQTGNWIAVADDSRPITFYLQDESTICCKVQGSIIGEYPLTRVDYLAKDVAVGYDIDNERFEFRLSSGYRTTLPTVNGFHLLKDNVQNRSFYKDVFLDSGIGLNSSKTLSAVSSLNLSLEGIRFSRLNATDEEIALQNEIIVGNEVDLNGRLLYPDGQPRFRLLFVVGGSATTHGKSLYEKGLVNMRMFVENGGSYVGTCAGAFLASRGYDGNENNPYYLSVWPGVMERTRLSDKYFGMSIEKNSPLLRYFDYGGDHYVDSIRHNRGGYPMDLPEGTEVLARFDCPDNSFDKAPSIWASKKNPGNGRVVQTGSHPEAASGGERRDLTVAMIQYALDGVAPVTIKGYLKNGVVRVMDKKTSDNNPSYTRIGDCQSHHFATYIPSGAKNICVEVSSPSNCDLVLMMGQETFAFSDTAEFISNNVGSEQRLVFPTIREGLWYIAVQCMTTVTVKETDYGQAYSGNTEVLNGVPYRILVSWD